MIVIEFLAGTAAMFTGWVATLLLLVAAVAVLAGACYVAGIIVAAPIAAVAWIARRVRP